MENIECCDNNCENCSHVNFSGYKWLKQERWGQIHPEKPYVWYDKSCVVSYDDNHIGLISKYKPKHFDHIRRTGQMAVGLISSVDEFGYGRYDLEAKLPNLAYSWPAFWMWSWSDWPPEIDIFEGYSDSKGRYDLPWWQKVFNNLFYKVQTNIHIKDMDDKWDIGGKSHFFGYKDPRFSFNKYSVIWTPKNVSFYYNDTMIRNITDGKILQLLNGHKMNVIINTSCYGYHRSHLKNDGLMEVKNFKYTEL